MGTPADNLGLDTKTLIRLINAGSIKATIVTEDKLWEYSIQPHVSADDAAAIRLMASNFFGMEIREDTRKFQTRALSAPEVASLILLGADMTKMLGTYGQLAPKAQKR